MASIKIKLHESSATGREGTIFFQITHERQVKQLFTNHHIRSEDWDDKRSSPIKSTDRRRNETLLYISDSIRQTHDRLLKIIRHLENETARFSTDDIIYQYNRYLDNCSFLNFADRIIIGLKRNDKIRTAETYEATVNSFRRFLQHRGRICENLRSDDILLDSIDTELAESYQAWLESTGIVPNTISFYNRIMRAIYNRAVDRELIDNRSPFRHVYTGIDKTVKRALPLETIRIIRTMELSSWPNLDFARDMFMLSFFMRGMSFIDMAFLRKTDLCDGYITYRRRKTGQILTVQWTDEMQQIIEKYPPTHSDYLLPIIRDSVFNERVYYRNAAYNINHNLKRIAVMAGISARLTMYVARHSWASAAHAKGIPVNIISEGMGHDSETTTRIYLASLDNSAIDRANAIIISAL